MLLACESDANLAHHIAPMGDSTKHVFVIVMDGARYSETFADSSQHTLVPKLYDYFSNNGIIANNFYNNGQTLTNPGHAAICTGVYQDIDNNGLTLPKQASMFQMYLKQYPDSVNKAWIVTSKGKLNILANTSDKQYYNKHLPNYNCGTNGDGIGYRNDSLTLVKAKEIVSTYLPNLMLLQFKEPDPTGHNGNWDMYIQEIKKTDAYIMEFIDYVNSITLYKGNSAFIITNDHGRHLNNVADGFASHGDDCEGCRHIMLLAAGPDFKKNKRITTRYEQIDIATTVAALLGFQMPKSQGKTMYDLFE
jgi:Sulfatase.